MGRFRRGRALKCLDLISRDLVRRGLFHRCGRGILGLRFTRLDGRNLAGDGAQDVSLGTGGGDGREEVHDRHARGLHRGRGAGFRVEARLFRNRVPAGVDGGLVGLVLVRERRGHLGGGRLRRRHERGGDRLDRVGHDGSAGAHGRGHLHGMFHGCFTRGNRRGFLLVRGKFDV